MEKKNSRPNLLLSFFLLTLFLCYPAICAKRMKRIRPCRSLVLYFHDILYDGTNKANATSAIVAAPAWANRTVVAPFMNFGDLVIFDDPITLDNNLHSPPIGRAQGLYLYDSKSVYTAWLGFSLVFNSTGYKGTLTLMGADPLTNQTRVVSVVGGTGDFFMARGVATIRTDALEGFVYFRLRLDIELYECY